VVLIKNWFCTLIRVGIIEFRNVFGLGAFSLAKIVLENIEQKLTLSFFLKEAQKPCWLGGSVKNLVQCFLIIRQPAHSQPPHHSAPHRRCQSAVWLSGAVLVWVRT